MFDLSQLTMTEIIRLQNQLQHELAHRFERALLTVFSDIVGSTPYFARFGDAMGRQMHQLHIDLLEHSFAVAGGRVVDAAGDGALCVFPSAEAGVQGVVDLQLAMARENAGRARAHQISVRIGMHWGSVLTDGAAVTGDSVHIAARVAKAAPPGATYLTRQVFHELGPTRRLNCSIVGPHELKGVAQPLELLALEWRDPLAFPRLVQIEETGETIELPHQDIVSFGRLKEHDGLRANDIVLRHPQPELDRFISRWHFELRRVADGLRLRALSDGHTTVDGEPVARGVDLPVRSGSLIGVARTLTLRLTLPPSMLGGEHDRTMTLIRHPGSGPSSGGHGHPPDGGT